ncbi:MAG: hypothetical protein J7L31_04265 [Thermoplasmata archaeon]|nr:hypothetical protein [Thermoplasmata archaeon]
MEISFQKLLAVAFISIAMLWVIFIFAFFGHLRLALLVLLLFAFFAYVAIILFWGN